MWISSEQLNRKSSVAPTLPCFQFTCMTRFITDRMWETLDDRFQFCFWECIRRIDHFAFCEARTESLNIYSFFFFWRSTAGFAENHPDMKSRSPSSNLNFLGFQWPLIFCKFDPLLVNTEEAWLLVVCCWLFPFWRRIGRWTLDEMIWWWMPFWRGNSDWSRFYLILVKLPMASLFWCSSFVFCNYQLSIFCSSRHSLCSCNLPHIFTMLVTVMVIVIVTIIIIVILTSHRVMLLLLLLLMLLLVVLVVAEIGCLLFPQRLWSGWNAARPWVIAPMKVAQWRRLAHWGSGFLGAGAKHRPCKVGLAPCWFVKGGDLF